VSERPDGSGVGLRRKNPSLAAGPFAAIKLRRPLRAALQEVVRRWLARRRTRVFSGRNRANNGKGENDHLVQRKPGSRIRLVGESVSWL
jgi:hypothetical protein